MGMADNVDAHKSTLQCQRRDCRMMPHPGDHSVWSLSGDTPSSLPPSIICIHSDQKVSASQSSSLRRLPVLGAHLQPSTHAFLAECRKSTPKWPAPHPTTSSSLNRSMIVNSHHVLHLLFSGPSKIICAITSHPTIPSTPPFRPPRLILTLPIQDLITLYCVNFYTWNCRVWISFFFWFFRYNLAISSCDLSLKNSTCCYKLSIWTSLDFPSFPRPQLL